MLNAKRYAYDGDKAGQGVGQVAYRQPNPEQQEPDNVADHTQGTGAQVFAARESVAADMFLTEGPECQFTYDKAGAAEWDTYDTDKTEQADKPPASPMTKPPRINQAILKIRRKIAIECSFKWRISHTVLL